MGTGSSGLRAGASLSGFPPGPKWGSSGFAPSLLLGSSTQTLSQFYFAGKKLFPRSSWADARVRGDVGWLW